MSGDPHPNIDRTGRRATPTSIPRQVTRHLSPACAAESALDGDRRTRQHARCDGKAGDARVCECPRHQPAPLVDPVDQFAKCSAAYQRAARETADEWLKVLRREGRAS